MGIRRTHGLAAFVIVALIALTGAACEKNNDIVAQEQLREAQAATCPEGCEAPKPSCEIKGNISAQGNKFYHVPGGRFYNGIKITPDTGERWFCNEREAVANGWRKSAE